ncbi:MAG: FAD-dependent oxidoreductase [Desulfobacterales bacterium]
MLYEMATRGTKKITVIEMIDKIGKDFGKTTRWGMLQDVKRYGVESKVTAKALEITSTGIKIEAPEGTEEIPADTVVLAVGSRPINTLEEIITSKGIPRDVIGDAQNIGMA